jgi:hypothetical protein
MSSNSHQELLVSYHKLQQTVGWIALLMPIVVRVLAFAYDKIFTTNSISAYYYTDLRDVFVGSLVVGGLLLAFFRTDDRKDRWIAIIAGLSAIGIALFPMDIAAGVLVSPDTANAEAEAKLVQALRAGPHGPLGYHFVFVGVFFLLTFYLVTFRFRANTPANPSRQKQQRNGVYVVCGGLMGLAFIWIGILWHLGKQSSIFWPETLAVMAFAAAWLVKGQLVLKDRHGPASHSRPSTQAGVA